MAAALDQPDVVQGPPALPAEQEFAGGGQGRDAVEEGLRIAPVTFPGGPRVDDVHHLAAVGVDPGQVLPGSDVGPYPSACPFQVVVAADALAPDAHHDEGRA